MKTVADYMCDPRIVNDPAMAGAPEPIRKIHAIRLMIDDETEGLTEEEKEALHKKDADVFFANIGLPPPKYVNLSGQGKLKPRVAVTAI